MVQAQAKVQEGDSKMGERCELLGAVSETGHRTGMSQGCMQATGRVVPFSKTQSQAENCDSREYACDSGEGRGTSWYLSRAV